MAECATKETMQRKCEKENEDKLSNLKECSFHEAPARLVGQLSLQRVVFVAWRELLLLDWRTFDSLSIRSDGQGVVGIGFPRLGGEDGFQGDDG